MIPGISTGGGGLSADLGGGPSSAGSTTNNNNGFTGGTVNMGSNNGVPTWALVGGALIAAYWLFGRKKRGNR
ncbi:MULTISPECIES: hypothetical protein [Vibrio]|uniref:Uncharacterized protein n=2 Tax=Vibrio TaxID=662 RepID=A0A0Q0TSL7_VIBMT|nr:MULTISPECIES: hypothetical protein [Vibrio]HAS2379477.1 hypothetical protein [Vibrio cholerae O1]EGR0412529.1 hypothetical protein [Vibrio cholerae]EGR1056941.1 hypothetical protein [Vibrio cholerae]EGR1129860.1 hypothetical protein [Vibrio cholerae]EGR1966265.1 hypothetical protein [Vibrio cholerae]